MRKYFFVFLCTLFVTCCFQAGTALTEEPENEQQAAQIEMTEEEITARLNEIFRYHPDIFASIQGMKQEGAEEEAVYTYNGTPLEKLDKETLMSILRTCNQQLSWKNYQRLEKQLKQLKQIDNLNKTQKMLKQQKTYTPPKVPKTQK